MSGFYASGASPLHDGYLVRNPRLRAALRLSDAVLDTVFPARQASVVASPQRVLLALGGHLGDAVIATSVLPLLADRFPGVELGMVLPSWSAPVVEGHQALKWIHTVDHWRLSRSADDWPAKWRRYRDTSHQSVAEIRQVGYDVSVDLYPFYPNMASILWRASIPSRIGYRSGGFGSLYTTSVPWENTPRHTAWQHVEILRQLDPAINASARGLRYHLPLIPAQSNARAESMLAAAGVESRTFVVVHAGVGAPQKAWPTPQWTELAATLMRTGYPVVFTGAGTAESQTAAELTSRLSGSTNFVGQLDWNTFRAVVSRARVVVGGDSVAAHIAAGQDVPCVAIMPAMSDPRHWSPLGDRVEVVTRGVPCAPCFRSNGCEPMTCVRDVTVAEVLAAVRRVTTAPGSN